jgi:hypothetical protein
MIKLRTSFVGTLMVALAFPPIVAAKVSLSFRPSSSLTSLRS